LPSLSIFKNAGYIKKTYWPLPKDENYKLHRQVFLMYQSNLKILKWRKHKFVFHVQNFGYILT
jgi:hypothetical protein